MRCVKIILYSWFSSKHWSCHIRTHYIFLGIIARKRSDRMESCPPFWSHRHLYLLHTFAGSHDSCYKKLLLFDHGVNSSPYWPVSFTWRVWIYRWGDWCPWYSRLGPQTRKDNYYRSCTIKNGSWKGCFNKINWALPPQKDISFNFPGRRTESKGSGRLYTLPSWYSLNN